MNSIDEGNSIGTVTPSPVERGPGGEVLKSRSLVEERGEVIKNGFKETTLGLELRIKNKIKLNLSSALAECLLTCGLIYGQLLTNAE